MILQDALRTMMSDDSLAIRRKEWRGKQRIEYNARLDVCLYFNSRGIKGSRIPLVTGRLIDTRWEMVKKEIFRSE